MTTWLLEQLGCSIEVIEQENPLLPLWGVVINTFYQSIKFAPSKSHQSMLITSKLTSFYWQLAYSITINVCHQLGFQRPAITSELNRSHQHYQQLVTSSSHQSGELLCLAVKLIKQHIFGVVKLPIVILISIKQKQTIPICYQTFAVFT